MRGFENIKLLTDGKILIDNALGAMYKLNDDKLLVHKLPSEKEWRLCNMPYNSLLTGSFREYIEYPYNFKIAIQKMLDGKVVESKDKKVLYRLWGDGFQYWNVDYHQWVYGQVKGSWFKVKE